MITVTFLGVGAAMPSPGQTNCAYLIEAAGARILFDCGPAILQQLAAVGRTPGDITHLFISHAHGDHALGWPMFRLWWTMAELDGVKVGTPPHVVASDQTWHHLRALWLHSYDDVPSSELPGTELPTDRPHTHQLTPDIAVLTWPMIHSVKYPVLGARFEVRGKVVAFTADAARSAAITELARGADLLIHDARHGVTVPPDQAVQNRFHCSALDAGENAQVAGAKNLGLVHIGPEYEGRHDALVAEARTKYAGNAFAPRAGESVTV